MMRFSEVLLNYAEILFMQGKPTEAYAELNKVRARAKYQLSLYLQALLLLWQTL
jgi:predicted Zn-dependent protease